MKNEFIIIKQAVNSLTLTRHMVVGKSDVEDVDSGFMGAVVDGVLAVVRLVTLDVRSVRAFDGYAETAIACITVSHHCKNS